MAENPIPLNGKSPENDNSQTFEDSMAQMKDEAWVIEHWEELGATGQELAFYLHGFEYLWNKILD